MAAGERNAYFCDACSQYVVTIDRENGVTPMFLACRVEGEPGPTNPCRGRMHSMMYPPEPWPSHDEGGRPIPTEPTYEWYTPDAAELKQLAKKSRHGDESAAATYDHVQRGGLLLRKIGAEDE